MEHRLLGITAAMDADHAEDLLPDLETRGLGAAFLNDAGRVAAKHPVFIHRGVLARSYFVVHRINARYLHADEHLARIRLGGLNLVCL